MYEMEILKVVEPGTEVKIVGEMRPPADINPKFRGFLMGEVEYQGGKYFISINKTSYINICKVYGEDTKTWLDKIIVYKGEEKIGNMVGKIWLSKA